MTLNQAIKAAHKRLRATGDHQYVIPKEGEFGPDGYVVVNDFDLDTWYAGTPYDAIKYCTAYWGLT